MPQSTPPSVLFPALRSDIQFSALRGDGDFSSKDYSLSDSMDQLELIGSTSSIDGDLDILMEIKRSEETESKGIAATVWIGAAIAFGLALGYFAGPTKAEEYFAGYLLEQSLSIDNLFVFILVFKYFKTPQEYQAKVLTYGIITAGILRLVMVLLGVEIIESFHFILLLFAALLVYSSLQLLLVNEDADEDMSGNSIVQLCKRFLSVTDNYDGDRFFTMEDGVRVATPLLLTLAVIELSDVVFAVDSVPAVFGITLDPVIVYSSNLFAILSLRSVYGFISTAMGQLRFLDKSVAVVLGLIGMKMVADFGGYHVSTDVSLFVVSGVLGTGVVTSVLFPKP